MLDDKYESPPVDKKARLTEEERLDHVVKPLKPTYNKISQKAIKSMLKHPLIIKEILPPISISEFK